MPKLPDLGGQFDPAVAALIELVVVACHPNLWPEDDVVAARRTLETEYASVPTLDDLGKRFGEQTVTAVANKVITLRQGRVLAVTYATMLEYSQHWPEAELSEARAWLQRAFDKAVSLDELAERYGEATVVGIAKRCVEARRLEINDATERLGIGSDCHLCGREREDDDPFYEFGLAEIVSQKKNWAGAAGTLALNALTVPFGVVVAPRGIGSTTTAKITRCRLVLCKLCANDRKNWLGKLKLGREDCSKHPSWKRLVDGGADRFFDHETLSQYRA